MTMEILKECYFISKYGISLEKYGIYFTWGWRYFKDIPHFTMANLYSVSFIIHDIFCMTLYAKIAQNIANIMHTHA